jgi:hypothetical protein
LLAQFLFAKHDLPGAFADHVLIEQLPVGKQRIPVESRPGNSDGLLTREPFLRMQNLLGGSRRIFAVQLLDFAPATRANGMDECRAVDVCTHERFEQEARQSLARLDRLLQLRTHPRVQRRIRERLLPPFRTPVSLDGDEGGDLLASRAADSRQPTLVDSIDVGRLSFDHGATCLDQVGIGAGLERHVQQIGLQIEVLVLEAVIQLVGEEDSLFDLGQIGDEQKAVCIGVVGAGGKTDQFGEDFLGSIAVGTAIDAHHARHVPVTFHFRRLAHFIVDERAPFLLRRADHVDAGLERPATNLGHFGLDAPRLLLERARPEDQGKAGNHRGHCGGGQQGAQSSVPMDAHAQRAYLPPRPGPAGGAPSAPEFGEFDSSGADL